MESDNHSFEAAHNEILRLREEVAYLHRVAKVARSVHNAWLSNVLTRKNGMVQLDTYLKSVGE